MIEKYIIEFKSHLRVLQIDLAGRGSITQWFWQIGKALHINFGRNWLGQLQACTLHDVAIIVLCIPKQHTRSFLLRSVSKKLVISNDVGKDPCNTFTKFLKVISNIEWFRACLVMNIYPIRWCWIWRFN